MARVLEVDLPPARPRLPRPARARGQHAIHHVHAALDRADDIVGLAHPHQVARLVFWQHFWSVIQTFQHGLLSFSNRQPANGIAVEADRAQRLGALLAKVALQPTLLNPEKRMTGPVTERLARPRRPAHR